ncbi:MAG: glycoside hydrolase family 3 C-terminal domain-containing protein [Rikenellaceae bacterium]
MKRKILTILAIGLVSVPSFAQRGEIKNDPSFKVRAKELVAKMTLEEKVSQTIEMASGIERLGVEPYNWWNEILHGVARSGDTVTVYPQAIAMAANFDREALQKMGDQASDEARGIYNYETEQGKFGEQYKGLTFWTPNINIFRDPRWGRGQETYGEDPYLTAELGKAMVTGLEGTDDKYLKVSACAKHYAVHSGPEHNRHVYDAKPTAHDLWNTYLPAFKALVEDAEVTSVMCAYNRFEGEPCCGSSNLMMDILRNDWGFTGYVTSDCGAVNDFWQHHQTSPDTVSAAVLSIQNGTDLECGAMWAGLWSYNSLDQAVKEGLLDESKLDETLVRLFEIRMRLGMFDDPSEVPYAQIGYDVVNSKEHAEHALLMARQSMVLLKNNGILPLAASEASNIAVVGPNADNEVVLLGNYNGIPENAMTAYEGIKAKFNANGSQVIYAKGTDYVLPYDSANDLESIKNSEIVVFVGGISADLEGEEGAVADGIEGFYGGDRTTIGLPKVQTDFMKQLKKMGKKIIFVNMSGSAMAMNWEDANVDAIIQAWYGGQAAGQAIADVISGDYNPSGRLPLTFYKSEKDLPDFEDYSMVNRTYRYFTGEPLYEFGFGLSYTTFEYSNIKVKESGDKYTVTATVKNTGKVAGDEVVQLYIRPEASDSRLALKSLRGFDRVSLKAGKSTKVTFELDKEAFAIYDSKGEPYYISGEYDICVGGSQPSKEAISRGGVVTKSIEL